MFPLPPVRVMPRDNSPNPIGLLLSGGLDSSILLGHLLATGHCVQPFYIRSNLAWEGVELAAARRFHRAMRDPRLAELVVLDLPLADLYQDHWSITGNSVPGGDTPDEAVYLPGRNALLLVKTAIWCRMRGIDQLALGVLQSNPFADATAAFFDALETALSGGQADRIAFLRPFAGLGKRQVMDLGRRLPLELTFSCLMPVDGLHCGRCNKCAERIAAFGLAHREDLTRYAACQTVT